MEGSHRTWLTGVVLVIGAVLVGRWTVEAEASGVAGNHHHHTGSTPCEFELATAETPILEGLACPAPGSTATLIGCHCAAAHAAKRYARRLIDERVPPDEVRQRVAELAGPSDR